uniref:Heparan sulfate glucosamine 3-O-sulfotransferase 3A1-like n=1 Tax=Saccoglossus kowalevskii TaxID=10224 RepID=A0ABM0GUY8_SACKO|nr:PREDICTED: heparan sulfate glucosamine 3-O-sulfotransferase 3A1-like [Saccoglossus kowalevskii]
MATGIYGSTADALSTVVTWRLDSIHSDNSGPSLLFSLIYNMAIRRWGLAQFCRSHCLELGVILICCSMWVLYILEHFWASNHQLPLFGSSAASSRDRLVEALDRQSKYQSVPYEAKHDVDAYIDSKFNNSCYKVDRKDLSNRVLLDQKDLRKRGCQQRLPQAVLIGMRKCGIGRILQFLRFHPAIEMRTSLLPLDFFSGSYKKGLELYRKQMPYTTESQLTVEKTPEYFIVPHDVPKKVRDEISPETRIVAVVCDPVKRLIADYVSLAVKDKNPEAIEQYMSDNLEKTVTDRGSGNINHLNALVDSSLYFKHFMRWMHAFPMDQILLIDAEAATKHPAREMQRLEYFLGLPSYFDESHFFFDEDHHKYCLKFPQDMCVESSPAKKSKSQKEVASETKGAGIRGEVPDELKSKLYDFFEPYDQMLADKFNQTLSWGNIYDRHDRDAQYKSRY